MQPGRGRSAAVAAIIIVWGLAALAVLATLGFARPAQALPSFARQTGQPCGTCHTDFPALTPFGRSFKLRGYTAGGGQFRRTPFDFDYAAAAEVLAQYTGMPVKAPPAIIGSTSDIWVPPIAVMAVVGLTHTQAPLPEPTAPFQPNNNIFPSPVSVFYGGAITDHIGTFAQLTFAGPGPGPPGPFDHNWGWDNVDVRYSNTGRFGGLDFVWGITANNSPSVQDVWNTTPAWRFPFASSTLAPTPSAATIIDGTFAQHVAGVGAYAWINDLVYIEGTGYKTLDFRTQNNLGANPFDAPGLIDGAAPYFRLAVEPHWGSHSLELGTFGLLARVAPWLTSINGSTAGITDKYTDIGFDSQYQYQGNNYWFTARGSYIHESQRLNASLFLGNAANLHNGLNTLTAEASLAYGADNRIVATAQYFATWGSFDPFFFAGSLGTGIPNSNGYVFELAYMPFGMSKAPLWPWFNARIGAQYIYYNEFDGDRVHAHDNNTFFLYAWLAM